MADERLPLAELMAKPRDGDFLRTSTESVLQIIWKPTSMAGRHERSSDRSTWRNGYRDHSLDTWLGTLNLKISKLRTGAYTCLARRKLSGRAVRCPAEHRRPKHEPTGASQRASSASDRWHSTALPAAIARSGGAVTSHRPGIATGQRGRKRQRSGRSARCPSGATTRAVSSASQPGRSSGTEAISRSV